MSSNPEPAIARSGLARNTLAGRVAIVTGAGSGVGREAARACAWLGARVVVAELGAAGRETAATIAAEGGDAHFVATDIADEGFANALAAVAAAQYAPADILINAAALCAAAPAAATAVALWDRTLAVNLRGPFLAARAVLPAMLAAGHGVIVNLVSPDTAPGLSAYCASQQGLIAFTRSLAAEVGARGVRVVAMTPGAVDLPALWHSPGGPGRRLDLAAGLLSGRPPSPPQPSLLPAEDIGAAVACLIADPAAGGCGELVSGYAVLERAGLIVPAARRCDSEPGHAADASAQVYMALPTGRARPELTREVGGHGRDAGELQAWEETLDDLERQIERAGADGKGMEAALHARWVMLRESLFSLQAYYARIPEETARFSGDPGFLRQVEQASLRRLRLIDDLLAALQHPSGHGRNG